MNDDYDGTGLFVLLIGIVIGTISGAVIMWVVM